MFVSNLPGFYDYIDIKKNLKPKPYIHASSYM